MAEYLIQDTTLDAIADAINAKTGGSSAMTPAEMVEAIGNIPSGGGGGITLETLNVSQNGTTNAPSGTAYNKVIANVANTYEASDEGKVVSNGALVTQTTHATVTQNGTIDTTLNNSVEVAVPFPATLDQYVKKTLPETFECDIANEVPAYTFYRQDGGCKHFRFPNATKIGNAAFYYCSAIESLFAPNATLDVSACSASNLIVCVSKGAAGSLAAEVFRGYGSYGRLTTWDCTANGYGIKNKSFENQSHFTTMILRDSAICPLTYETAFMGTPFASGGSGGTIYIPKSLYDHLGDGTANDYKAATNWSTLDGYGTITWAQIEGSIYETQYADGTPIPTE